MAWIAENISCRVNRYKAIADAGGFADPVWHPFDLHRRTGRISGTTSIIAIGDAHLCDSASDRGR